jgi:hypothetical protein
MYHFNPASPPFCGAGCSLQREAVALVAPRDLVAVLHDVIQSVGANGAAAGMVPLEGFDIAGHGPHHRLALRPAAAMADSAIVGSVSS